MNKNTPEAPNHWNNSEASAWQAGFETAKDKILENIFQTLQRQKFADWYNNLDFDRWISGDLPKITDEAIKEQIKKIFFDLTFS